MSNVEIFLENFRSGFERENTRELILPAIDVSIYKNAIFRVQTLLFIVLTKSLLSSAKDIILLYLFS